MKLIKTIGIISVSLLILISCRNPSSVNTQKIVEQKKFEFGEEFEIGFGETFYHDEESVKIKFEEVVEESRCPANVMCVWAGNAKIQIQTEVEGYASEFELDTHQDLTTKTNFERFKVKLAKLDPYPQSGQNSIPKEEYIATIIMESNN